MWTRSLALTSFVTALLLAACGDAALPTEAAGDGRAPRIQASLASLAGSGTPAALTSALDPKKCADVRGASAARGTPLILRTCRGEESQQFTWLASGEIRVFGTMCVDVSGKRGQNGDPVIIWPCHGGANQKWTATGSGEIRGVNGKCLDVWRANPADGTHLVVYSCHGGANQRWSAGSASAPATTPPPSVGGTAARSADAFVSSVGVNIHLGFLDRVYSSGYSSIILPKLKRLGVRHLRDGGPTSPNRWFMDDVYRRYREVAASTGAKFTILISPRGTDSGPGTNYGDAGHVRTLLDYIGRDNVVAFEGLNEHDRSNRPNFAAEVRSMQQALFRTIKGDPALAAKYAVIAPTVVSSEAARAVGDLSAYSDYGAMHSYPGGQRPSEGIAYNVAKFRVVNGARPVQATETGYHNAMRTRSGFLPASESASGKYIPRLFLEYFNAGVVRTFSYELIDQGRDAAEEEHNFGLLRIDGSEKPAYVALRNLIALLADPGPAFQPGKLAYTLSGDTTNVHHSLFQKRDGRFYLVLWQEVSSYDVARRADLSVAPRALTVTLGRAARRARVYVPLRSDAPATTAEAPPRVVVSVPDHPVVVELTP